MRVWTLLLLCGCLCFDQAIALSAFPPKPSPAQTTLRVPRQQVAIRLSKQTVAIRLPKQQIARRSHQRLGRIYRGSGRRAILS